MRIEPLAASRRRWIRRRAMMRLATSVHWMRSSAAGTIHRAGARGQERPPAA